MYTYIHHHLIELGAQVRVPLDLLPLALERDAAQLLGLGFGISVKEVTGCNPFHI